MAKTPKAKPAASQSSAKPEAAPRRLKMPRYKSFRLQKRIKGKRLPGAFTLFKSSLTILGRNWKLFLGIVLVYGILNALLVQGFNAVTNVEEAKRSLDEVFAGGWAQLANGLTLFAYLVSVSGNTLSPAAGTYQLFLSLIMSLALIWTFRQVFAGQKVRVRDGFYQGMAPLVQFVLVLLVIALQFIPFALGLTLYNIASANGIAVSSFEQIMWAIFLFLTVLISLYMVASSLFALYIVTLPGMTPLKALRSARELVLGRRWAIIRKVLLLPIILLVLAGVIIIPLLIFLTPVAAWAFFAVSLMLLPLVHSYMYTLYRALME